MNNYSYQSLDLINLPDYQIPYKVTYPYSIN